MSEDIRPDSGSGSYMWLIAAAVDLARRDMSSPVYSMECREDLCSEPKHTLGDCAEIFLRGPLVTLFADTLGYEGSFTDGLDLRRQPG